MKIGCIRSFWIALTLIFATAKTCTSILFHYYFKKPTRADYDKILQHWITELLDRARVHCTVLNPLNVQPEPGKPIILMCNHSSAFDIPLAFKAFPEHSIRMLAKKELSKFPLLGNAMSAADFPFIDRKNRYQAVKDLQHTKMLMESGIIIWLAPEGTRSKTGKLAPFKKGGFITAIQAKATIIPIGIRGAFNILPGKSLRLNLDQQAELHIGQPIDAAEYTLDNKEELLQRTYVAIKELIGE